MTKAGKRRQRLLRRHDTYSSLYGLFNSPRSVFGDDALRGRVNVGTFADAFSNFWPAGEMALRQDSRGRSGLCEKAVVHRDATQHI